MTIIVGVKSETVKMIPSLFPYSDDDLRVAVLAASCRARSDLAYAYTRRLKRHSILELPVLYTSDKGTAIIVLCVPNTLP